MVLWKKKCQKFEWNSNWVTLKGMVRVWWMTENLVYVFRHIFESIRAMNQYDSYNFRAVFNKTWALFSVFFLHHWLEDPCHCELKLTTTTTYKLLNKSTYSFFPPPFRFKNRLETTNSRYDNFFWLQWIYNIYKSKVSFHSRQLMWCRCFAGLMGFFFSVEVLCHD